MKTKMRERKVSGLIQRGARFSVRRSRLVPGCLALCVGRAELAEIMPEMSSREYLDEIVGMLNAHSETLASNDVLHRRLVEAEAALVRIANDRTMPRRLN